MEAYDKVVKKSCGRLTDYQQLITGFTTERELDKAVQGIYKNPSIAKHFAGKAQMEKKIKEELLIKPKGRFREGKRIKVEDLPDANVKTKLHYTDEGELMAIIEKNVYGLRDQLRRQTAIKEQQEVMLVSLMAELDEKRNRGETLTRAEIAKMRRVEDAIDMYEDQMDALRSQIERGKVQERTLAEMQLEALTEAEEAQRKLGKEQRRATRQELEIAKDKFANLSKREWIEIIEGSYDVLADAMDMDNFKEMEELKRMQVRSLNRYIFDELGFDPRELYGIYFAYLQEQTSPEPSEASETSEEVSISIDDTEETSTGDGGAEVYSEGVYSEGTIDYPE